MRILVFEPAKGGHHLVYLRCVLEDLLSAGHTLFLAAEEGLQPSAALTTALGPLLNRCQWIPLSHDAARLIQGRRLNAIVRAQEQAKADLVFLNCFDLISSSLFRRTAFGLPPPKSLHGKITGIFVRPRIADHRVRLSFGDRLKQAGFRRLWRSNWFERLLILDETLPTALTPGLDPARFHVIPDPWSGDFSIDRAEARRVLGLPADKFLFMHYGTSSPRKGLPTVAAAASIVPESDAALVVAGPFSEREGTHALLNPLVAAGRAYLFDRYIRDDEPLFFRACDVVLLAYEGHYGSSNIQSRAAAAARPVIASDEGLVGERVRRHRLGLTFPARDAAGLAAALTRARSQPAAALAPGMSDYAAIHSRESFRIALLAALK